VKEEEVQANETEWCFDQIRPSNRSRRKQSFSNDESKDEATGAAPRNWCEGTLHGCECLLEQYGYTGEWHHVSKFAREVDYYDVDLVMTLFRDAPSEELHQIAISSTPKQQKHEQMNLTVKLKYRDYISKKRYRMKHYRGPATVVGDWIEFGGKKKRLSGKFIEVQYLPEEPQHFT